MEETNSVLNPKQNEYTAVPYGAPDPSLNDQPKNSEQTKSQFFSSAWLATLSGRWMALSSLPATYKTYRDIRASDPTIAIAREFAINPILSAHESIEADDDVSNEIQEFVQKQWNNVKLSFKDSAMRAIVDYGWGGWEIVYVEDNGQIGIKQLKPLLHDITAALISLSNGELVALRQPILTMSVPLSQGIQPIELEKDYFIHLVWRTEGSYWYGFGGMLETVRNTANTYNDIMASAIRYFEKHAGAHLIVKFPVGVVEIANDDGTFTTMDNATIASQIGETLKSSGFVTIPQQISQVIDNLNSTQPGWEIEINSDGGAGNIAYMDMLKYLDALKVRSFGLPERSMLEATMGGSRADSESHADLALLSMEIKHNWLVDQINRQIIDKLVRINYGSEYVGKIRLVANPLVDSKKNMYKEIYMNLISNPSVQGEIDLNAMMDVLDIQKLNETAVIEIQPQPVQMPNGQNESIPATGDNDNE